MKENKIRTVSTGNLTLVVKPDANIDETRKITPPEKKINEGKHYSQWVNYHYSYAEFIHSYVKHINTLRRLNEGAGKARILSLYKRAAEQ